MRLMKPYPIIYLLFLILCVVFAAIISPPTADWASFCIVLVYTAIYTFIVLCIWSTFLQ